MEWITTSSILSRLHDPTDETVWTGFTERFRPPLFAFARRQGLSTADADDVAQDALLAFLERYRQGIYSRARGRLSSWLFGIASRRIREVRRRRAREAVRRAPEAAFSSFWETLPGEEEVDIWEEEWQRAVLASCLRQAQCELKAKTFRAFQLVVQEGKEPAAAARELGITRAAVYVAKHRVLKRLGELRRQLEEID